MGGGVGHTIVTRVEEDSTDNAGDVPIEADEPPGDATIVVSDSEDEEEVETMENQVVNLGAEDGVDEDDGYEGFAPL